MKNSPEHRANQSAAFATPEAQAKLSARWKGKTQSEEHRAARAKGMRGNANGAGRKISPEQRAALIAGRRKQADADKAAGKKRTFTPEQKAQIAAKVAAYHATRSAEEKSAMGRKMQAAQSAKRSV